MLFLFFKNLMYILVSTTKSEHKMSFKCIDGHDSVKQTIVKIKKKDIPKHKNGLNKNGLIIDISHFHYPTKIEEGEHKLCSFCMKYMAKWTFGCDKCDADACENCAHHLSMISAKTEMLPSIEEENSIHFHQMDIKGVDSIDCSSCGEEKSSDFVRCSRSECSYIKCKDCDKKYGSSLLKPSFEQKFKKKFFKDVVVPLGWTEKDYSLVLSPPPPPPLPLPPLAKAVEEIRMFLIARSYLN